MKLSSTAAASILCLACALVSGSDRTEPQVAVAAQPPVWTFEIVDGQTTPQVALKVTNTADASIVVCKPIDGCDVGWRIVSYAWVVTGPDGQPAKKRGMARCGNVNGLEVDDFVTVGAGKTVSIEGGFLSPPMLTHDMSTPGKYRIQLTYTFTPKDPGRGLAGPNEDGTDALVAKAWEGTVTSKDVEYEVKEQK